MFFLFTALTVDQVQAFCTSAPHRAVVPCDSTAFLILFYSDQNVQTFAVDGTYSLMSISNGTMLLGR